jgi:hypothetical protein
MSIRVLVIESSPEYRALIGNHITVRWRDAKVTEYDPAESGRFSENFAGAGSDVVILGDPIAAVKGSEGSELGLDWLAQFRQVKGFPPVIVVGDGVERSIVKAIKLGAADYISRATMTHKAFIGLIETALEEQDANSERSQTQVPGDTLEIPGLKGYTVKRCISRGDIAAVYLARDLINSRDVVLKVLRQVPDFGGDEIVLDRFLAEFEAIGKISHPNIVDIFDLGIADNHAFIAMEYCSRGSLKRLIRQGMFAKDAEQIMRRIAGALDVIHQAGILHRDLKPTNVLFREDESLALIDFGLAKQAHLDAELTGTGEIFGTPYYMSPEQGHGESIDERSDIYSLGIVFYEMLTGKKPYEGKTAMAVILKHAREPIPTLPEHLVNYQPAIDKMMAKRPGHRFQSVAELLEWQPATA